MTALTEYIDKITGGDTFLAGILNTFIADHTSRFGSVISEDELLSRLKQNLVGINLVEGELSFSYSGFNEKIITAGCVNDNLQDPEYLSQFTQGIRRELVKAIYTVPKAASYSAESLMFGTYEKLSDNSVLLVGGNDRFKDALVTYIEGSEKSVFDEFSKYAGEKTLITAAFHSNEEDFRKLFDAFYIDKAYSSFAEHLGGKGDEDTEFFKEFYDAYLPGVSDRNIIAQAPFWKEKKYRRLLTDEMDESGFRERLLRALDHEVQLHPDFREAILRGENAALVNLVKEEYLNDIHLEKVRELEKDTPEGVDEKSVEGTIDNESFVSDEEETVFIDDITLDEEEKQRKNVEREKRAAFSKRRNEQYASSNAKIDERHWQENEYLASRRRIEEERLRVQKFYEDALASSTLKQVDMPSYSSGSNQSRYKDEADYYRKTRQESDEYYEHLRREAEKKEQYKAYQEANDREYYKRLYESENYISKNTEGHINFNEKDRQEEYQTEGYSPIYEEKEFPEKPFQGDVGYESQKFSASSYGAPEPGGYRYEPVEGAYSDPLVNVRSDEYLKAEYDEAVENTRKADYVYGGRYSDNNMYEGTHVDNPSSHYGFKMSSEPAYNVRSDEYTSAKYADAFENARKIDSYPYGFRPYGFKQAEYMEDKPYIYRGAFMENPQPSFRSDSDVYPKAGYEPGMYTNLHADSIVREEVKKYKPYLSSDPAANVRSDTYMQAKYDAALENTKNVDYGYSSYMYTKPHVDDIRRGAVASFDYGYKRFSEPAVNVRSDEYTSAKYADAFENARKIESYPYGFRTHEHIDEKPYVYRGAFGDNPKESYPKADYGNEQSRQIRDIPPAFNVRSDVYTKEKYDAAFGEIKKPVHLYENSRIFDNSISASLLADGVKRDPDIALDYWVRRASDPAFNVRSDAYTLAKYDAVLENTKKADSYIYGVGPVSHYREDKPFSYTFNRLKIDTPFNVLSDNYDFKAYESTPYKFTRQHVDEGIKSLDDLKTRVKPYSDWESIKGYRYGTQRFKETNPFNVLSDEYNTVKYQKDFDSIRKATPYRPFDSFEPLHKFEDVKVGKPARLPIGEVRMQRASNVLNDEHAASKFDRLRDSVFKESVHSQFNVRDAGYKIKPSPAFNVLSDAAGRPAPVPEAGIDDIHQHAVPNELYAPKRINNAGANVLSDRYKADRMNAIFRDVTAPHLSTYRRKNPFEDLEHGAFRNIRTENKSGKDPINRAEKSRSRAREYFEKAAEKHNAAIKNVRYLSRATGYTSFVAGTGRAFKYYMIGALSDGDTANVMITYNKLRRYNRLASTFVTTPFMKKITKVSSMEKFMKADLYERTGRRWFVDSATKQEVDAKLKKLIHSKKARTKFLEEMNIFDYSSKTLRAEFQKLRLLEKRGLLTKEQAARLKTLRKGIPLSSVEMRIKVLLKKKKKGALTEAEEKLLNDLLKVKNLTSARNAKQKSWVRSAFYLVSDHLRKAEDTGTQGLIKLADFSTSIYTRRTVRASVRFSKFLAGTGGKVLKKGGSIYLTKTKSGRAIAKGSKLVKEKVEKEVGKKIASIAQSKAGRFSQKGFKLLTKGYKRIRSPFGGRVSRALRKVTDIVTKPIQLISKVSKAVSAFLGKVGIVLGGILIGMILFIVLTEAISSVFSFILEDEMNGKITLKPYVEVLEAKNEEFTKKVNQYADTSRYDHIYYELSTEDNTKEILSMMAVRFNQEMNKKHTTKEADEDKCDHYQEVDGRKYCLGHRDEALNYVRTLYDASHVINVTESAPYNCGRTSSCTHRVAETKTITVDGEEKEITTYHCPGDHIDATISSSVLHFDEIFMVDGNNGIYGNAGAPPLAKGESIAIPTGLGSVHTYMGWHTITNKSSNQYRLKVDAGENYDGEGFARIGDRYVIACTTTYGQVGDYVDFYQQDGSVLKCIIGDIKNPNDAGCNKWGHQNGECIIEFVVNGATWYFNGAGSHPNPGTSQCHPEWNQNLTKAVNRGNYWRNDYTEEEKETDKDTSKPEISAAQKLVADNARNGISTYPPTLNYCAAWVSGVYEASGQGYPGGNAIDFWNRWKSSGSTSMNNIPVGAVVVGSGSGSMGAIYGHVGIYIGNGMVAENIGRLNIVSLDAWAAAQKQTCQGHKGFIGWVWPNNKPLGQGVDGSSGTGGYTDFSFWDDFHKDWAKNIYNQDWDEIYVEWGADIDLDWTDSTIEIDGSKMESFRKLMDDLEGSKYRQGAAGPYEFDSSGLIKYLYEESRVYEFGEERPTCESLAKTSIEMEEEDAKFGDLIIWTDDSGNATHVAVYCGYDKIYECTPDSGVRYTKIYDKENAKFYRLAVND